MKAGVFAARKASRILFNIRLVYLALGILASIIAHELFHILIHLGDIKSIQLFPNLHTVVEITTAKSAPSSLTEELFAYSITAAILFITVIDIFAIHDSRNHKDSRDVLFGSQDDWADVDSALFMEIATKAKLI